MSWTLAVTYWGYEFDAWSVLGFLGTAVFATRFIVQWIVSEIKGQSTIPVAFWWISIAGSILQFIYFQHRADPVGVASFSLNTIIYLRNLQFIAQKKRDAASPSPKQDDAENR